MSPLGWLCGAAWSTRRLPLAFVLVGAFGGLAGCGTASGSLRVAAHRVDDPVHADAAGQLPEEEQEWFPQGRAALGRNRLADLGEQLAAAKPTAPRDPLKVPSADQ
ncbi:hypothetical protein [Streptomyces sp. NPDC008139]|uniref:hypothetical protein n=1 Tax=Streptomyces sp. NPDC008139 TaxID=3364814 RepID=UPI0036F10FBB